MNLEWEFNNRQKILKDSSVLNLYYRLDGKMYRNIVFWYNLLTVWKYIDIIRKKMRYEVYIWVRVKEQRKKRRA